MENGKLWWLQPHDVPLPRRLHADLRRVAQQHLPRRHGVWLAAVSTRTAATSARGKSSAPPWSYVGAPLRRAVSDPMAPLLVLAAALAASAALGARTPAWLALAGIAGHSLSGST